MTPTERARQIDKEEFAAECAAARQRAFAYVSERRKQERQKVRSLLGLPPSTDTEQQSPQTGKHGAFLYTVNGETHSLTEWAEILGVSRASLHARLNRGYSPVEALSPNFKRKPYVSPNPIGRRAKLYALNGVSKSIAQWAASRGLKRHTVAKRVRKGMTLAEALTVPSRQIVAGQEERGQ
jgi:hypothetical protein